LEALKNIEHELKMVRLTLTEKEDQLISVQKSLDRERDEKMSIIEDKHRDEELWALEKNSLLIEKDEIREQLKSVIEISQNEKNMQDKEDAKIPNDYNNLLNAKVSAESENCLLKKEISRLLEAP